MSQKTSIEWTDAVWNPIGGCSRVSPGCENCYAERQAIRQVNGRMAGLVRSTDRGPRWTGQVRLFDDRLGEPLRWKRPRRVFVNSMSDLFHESIPDEWIESIWIVMGRAIQHTFQILTKRAERMRRFVEGNLGCILPNVWLGVSVEDQARAEERIPLLLQTPAAVRFVSYEPALGPIDFDSTCEGDPCSSNFLTGIAGQRIYDGQKCAIDWVIVGGESGPGARPFDVAWARSTIAQCRAAGVPVFCKQLGARPRGNCCDKYGAMAAHDSDRYALPLRDRKGGDPQEWPEDLRVREFPR